MKFSQICMDQCYFFHCLCTQHSCVNRSDCPRTELNKQKMMHGWIFWYITKMMQAITYVITSIIRFNYLIRNVDFTHSNLIVRKMNKEFLHEKLTMFTSAQHPPPPRCTAYVYMMAKHPEHVLNHSSHCYCYALLLYLSANTWNSSICSFQQYMVQSLPVNFDLQHLAPAELVLGHNIVFASHSQRSIIVNSQADIERIFTV